MCWQYLWPRYTVLLFHSGERSDEISGLELPCRQFSFALICVFLRLFECSSDDSYLFFKQSGLNTGNSSLKMIFSVCFNSMNRRSIHFVFFYPLRRASRELDWHTWDHLGGHDVQPSPPRHDTGGPAEGRGTVGCRSKEDCSHGESWSKKVHRHSQRWRLSISRKHIKSFQSLVLIWWIFFNVASAQFV